MSPSIHLEEFEWMNKWIESLLKKETKEQENFEYSLYNTSCFLQFCKISFRNRKTYFLKPADVSQNKRNFKSFKVNDGDPLSLVMNLSQSSLYCFSELFIILAQTLLRHVIQNPNDVLCEDKHRKHGRRMDNFPLVYAKILKTSVFDHWSAKDSSKGSVTCGVVRVQGWRKGKKALHVVFKMLKRLGIIDRTS